MILGEYANAPIDLLRVLKMVLIHDLVEIDAGDTFIYDTAAQAGKRSARSWRPTAFSAMLPDDQAQEMRALWEEFEAEETPEARFAAALDRLQPLLCNYCTQGGAWKEYDVRASAVFARNRKIARGSDELWEHARGMLDDALRRRAI